MILVVDAMPVVYQAYSTVGHLSTGSGEFTGMRYGFLRNVRSWAEKFGARKVVICWDTPEPVLKAAGSPEYKEDRVRSLEWAKMMNQVPALKAMIALTNWSQVESPGYESDDLCVSIAREYERSLGEDVIIVTVDRDLLAGVSSRISVFLNGAAKQLVTQENIRSQLPCEPATFPAIKALMGDVSDNIKGVPCLSRRNKEAWGDVAALFVAAFPGVDKLPTGAELMESSFGMEVAMGAEDVEVYDRNLAVLQIVDVERDLWKVTKGTKDAAALTELFGRLEFKSMLRYVEQLTADQSDWSKVPPAPRRPRVKKAV